MRLLPLGGQSGTPAATTTAMNVVPQTVKQSVPLRHRARGRSVWRVVLLALLCAVVAPWPAPAGTLAQFRTPIGTLDVELYDQDKPITVRNFIRYVQAGAYTNMFLHRWVPGFVIQGGGFFVTNRFTAPTIPNVRTFAPILNEYNGDARFSNLYGTIAMAKLGGDPNSATSQWFFNLANNAANLDTQNGGFTVFGRVIGGTNVLNRFNSTTTTNGVFSKTSTMAPSANCRCSTPSPATTTSSTWTSPSSTSACRRPTAPGSSRGTASATASIPSNTPPSSRPSGNPSPT